LVQPRLPLPTGRVSCTDRIFPGLPKLERMNEAHEACGGEEWRSLMRTIVPSALGDVDLGDDVLEVGPGYGAATDVVCESVKALTSVEIDPKLVAFLEDRFASQSHVHIRQGDATALEFEAGRFTGAI